MAHRNTEKDQSYYMIIPAVVWNSGISPQAKLLYGHITVLANKNGYAFCSNAFLAKALDAKIPSIKTWLKQLTDLGVINREVTYKEDSKEIQLRKIYLTTPDIPASIPENTSQYIEEYRPGIPKDPDNNTRDNNTRDNILDDIDIVKGKMFFKLVDMYPKNRVGNRQHGLKKFKKLDIDQAKLTLVNLNRYLKVAGTYVKNLQNYITEECYSEAWLSAEETNTNKSNITNTKTFTEDYDNIS